MFQDGIIHDVVIRDLVRFSDERGWLTELFREDEIPREFMPVMAYVSITRSGIARGPHEHRTQADYFFFIGPSTFRVYLWDNRKGSGSYNVRQTVLAGEDSPKSVIIPPGVVHAYRNMGHGDGMVINCANQLYRGRGKQDPIDEIRHEDDPDTEFKLS